MVMIRKAFFRVLFIVLLASLQISGFAQEVAPVAKSTGPKTVLLYGDSLVWGWTPTLDTAHPRRLPRDERIGGAMEAALGSGWQVIEEGLNGRTAGVNADYYAYKGIATVDQNFNGRPSLLPILWSHEPVDVVVIMLGSNDARNYLHQSIADVSASVTALIQNIKLGFSAGDGSEKCPQIVLVAPPGAKKGENKDFNAIFDAKSYALIGAYPAAYKKAAQKEGVLFFNAAGLLGIADGLDGIHLNPPSAMKLGKALAEFVKLHCRYAARGN
jgi:lysophospholipase L1-like esterase